MVAKSPKPEDAKDHKTPELAFTRNAASACRKIDSGEEQEGVTTTPYFLIGDSEGSGFVWQVSFQSLDDSYTSRFDVTAPAEYKRPKVVGSVAMKEVWEKLDCDMKAQGHDTVYILFHNGAAHDEKLFREQSHREKCAIPNRFKFGDSISLLKALFPPSSLNSWSMESVYSAFIGAPIGAKSAGQTLRQHTAYYDVTQLREVLRFVAMYASRYISQKANDPIYTVSLARAHIMPTAALGLAAYRLMCHLVVHKTDWRSIEYDQSVADSNSEVVQMNPMAVWTTPSKRMRHTKECYVIKRCKNAIQITDPAALELLPFCQKCASDKKK